MTLRDQYVTKETVCNEIARFKGYLDNDMIARMQMAIISLPYENVIDADYDSFNRKMAEMEGR